MISPLDVIPDAIPIAGLTDDLAVLLYVLKKLWTGIDPEIIAKAREKLSRWFDEEEINEIQNLFDDEEYCISLTTYKGSLGSYNTGTLIYGNVTTKRHPVV